MLNRPGGALALAIGLLAIATVLPIAEADHAYSHRYVIWGRVIDANGNPVPNVVVDMVTNEFFKPSNACVDRQDSDHRTEAYGSTLYDPTTDERGDFAFCFHVHQINREEPGNGIVRINEFPEFQQSIRLDPYFRQQFLLLEVPQVVPSANAAVLNSTYTVIGRLWMDAGIQGDTVEDIPVWGDVAHHEPVEIKIKDASGNVVAEKTARSNDYGDFAVHIPVTSRVANGTVEMTARGQTFTEPAGRGGVTVFKATVPEPESRALINALIIGAAVLGLGAVVGGGYFAIRKFTENRELEQLRETSTRKRAKK